MDFSQSSTVEKFISDKLEITCECTQLSGGLVNYVYRVEFKNKKLKNHNSVIL